MKKLLSFPPNLVDTFKGLDPKYATGEWFCTCDPIGKKLGSGAGTTWLLDRWEESEEYTEADKSRKKIIIHAGGQSRRLPAYATVGKVLTPIPVLRWAVGEKIDRDLLSLQLPLYEKILKAAPQGLNTLIASGDVCLWTDSDIKPLPDVDVVCYGLWADPSLASHHGVFLSRQESPDRLDFMLQKPSVEKLNTLSGSHYYMMDIGLWVLSDRAVEILRRKSQAADGSGLQFYDLYSQFGCGLGDNPSAPDAELAGLTTAILPLPGGEFYHFGTTRELLSSTLALQNKVVDQRLILHRKTKPNPALFVQNCIMKRRLTSANENIWVENSYVGRQWEMTRDNVITGVPENDWALRLPQGSCIDIVPVGENRWAVRTYDYDDPMRGATDSPDTVFMGRPVTQWLEERGVTLPATTDIQSAPLFPLLDNIERMGTVARWMISEPDLAEGREIWEKAEKLSADDISNRASLNRLYEQRRQYLSRNIEALAENYERSVFYQLDLDDLADKINGLGLKNPPRLSESAPLTERMRNHMLRSVVRSRSGLDGKEEEAKAYEMLRNGITSTVDKTGVTPHLDVYSDQIVWGRSPVRIDLAGGWTDTPPYSVLRGGNVVNVAVELNSLPPLQVFVKPTKEPHIVLRSIDLGATERVESYEQLHDFNKIGSPFSLPKAALALCGFSPRFCQERYPSLQAQLGAFGSGIEITLLSAVPAGSGMGTSSILAATILGTLANFCGLAWDTEEICNRALVMEQLLTTCGGWQDQYGGVLQGLKLLRTECGWNQQPRTNWLPCDLFTDPMYAPCHILYYTGLTRVAKGILGEIVKRMFLNREETLRLLDDMRRHALDMAEAIQHRDFKLYGSLIGKTWIQNQMLDSGTNPAAVKAIIEKVDDYLLGCKLPGAGGGGFLYMVAKDPECAARVRSILTEDPVNKGARFVDMKVSVDGLRVSRS